MERYNFFLECDDGRVHELPSPTRLARRLVDLRISLPALAEHHGLSVTELAEMVKSEEIQREINAQREIEAARHEALTTALKTHILGNLALLGDHSPVESIDLPVKIDAQRRETARKANTLLAKILYPHLTPTRAIRSKAGAAPQQTSRQNSPPPSPTGEVARGNARVTEGEDQPDSQNHTNNPSPQESPYAKAIRLEQENGPPEPYPLPQYNTIEEQLIAEAKAHKAAREQAASETAAQITDGLATNTTHPQQPQPLESPPPLPAGEVASRAAGTTEGEDQPDSQNQAATDSPPPLPGGGTGEVARGEARVTEGGDQPDSQNQANTHETDRPNSPPPLPAGEVAAREAGLTEGGVQPDSQNQAATNSPPPPTEAEDQPDHPTPDFHDEFEEDLETDADALESNGILNRVSKQIIKELTPRFTLDDDPNGTAETRFPTKNNGTTVTMTVNGQPPGHPDNPRDGPPRAGPA